ncbi:MAG: hypothetical protein CVV23_10670 [Ignavibacteriae bacterium HGW-Ignavibacteriae-2]|nr:MAG: hypothetical protein CVV23_10670 [Ignavibacteriae bacterium HGW-Ignavibacteriae-2]
MCVLKNKIVLITRSGNQSPKEIQMLRKQGAFVIPFPTIEATPIEDFSEIDEEINRLAEFDYLIFTSINSVEYFLDRLKFLKSFIPDKVNVICVGSKTLNYCRSENITVSMVPEEFSAKGILDSFIKTDLVNKSILIPGSAISRDELSKGLKAAGASVTSIPVYNIAIPDGDSIVDEINFIKENHPHIFIFTSPSSFRNYLLLMRIDNVSEYFKNSLTIPIGYTTKDELNNYFVKSDLIPDEFTVEGCVKILIQSYSNSVN